MAKLESDRPNCFLMKLVFNDAQYSAPHHEPIVDLRFDIGLCQLLYLLRPASSSASPSLTHSPAGLAHCFLPSAYIKVPLDFEYSVATSFGSQAMALQGTMAIAIKLASSSHLASPVEVDTLHPLAIEVNLLHRLLAEDSKPF